ncbi:MAG TPA: hypothetical protein VLH13_03545, partial [Methanomassiliicoccales archaeon]|nr:hypothetical protein [Methanomassiliicoccales archaeon]
MRRRFYVGAVLSLCALTVTMSLIGVNYLSSLRPDPVPYGEFERVDMMSRYEVRLTVGEISGPLAFDRCLLVVFSPDNIEITQVRLEEGKWSYLLKDSQLTLSSVVLVDDDLDSMLEEGDEISLFHLMPLDKGAWTLRAFTDGNPVASLECIVVVPDVTETPYGVFRTADIVSPSEAVLAFGIVSGKVPFHYTCIGLVGPDGTTVEWRPDQAEPFIFRYNDTVWLSISDLEEKGIINYNDLL